MPRARSCDPSPCTPGDGDNNGRVDIFDLLLVLEQYGRTCPPPDLCEGDVNGDFVVDIFDMLMVLANWTSN